MDNSVGIDLVDLDQYPIDKLDHPDTHLLIQRMQSELLRDGASCLRQFLNPSGIERLCLEAQKLAPLAYAGPGEASPYFFDYQNDRASTLPGDHPLNVKTPRRMAQVAGDLIPQDSALRNLYLDSRLIRFFAAVLGESELHPSADRYQALNISVMNEGGRQQWHFDGSRCVITLLLQAPESGGDFEYVPGIRKDDDECFDDVKRAIAGKHEDVRSVKLEAGTLMFFRGRHALHRVTPVAGTRQRLQSILAYNPQPGYVGSIDSTVLHYGDRVDQQRADASKDHVARTFDD